MFPAEEYYLAHFSQFSALNYFGGHNEPTPIFGQI